MIKYLFLLIYCFEYFNKTVSGTIISKCFHEGDFTVSCNRSKLPSSLKHPPQELMRYAKVTNGLQHNESLCSYIPGASCSRTLHLSHCIDKPHCHIKNYWFSLEPDCPGNSYYTQFEYDCQPAFHICDKENLINAFSGLIYSPSYPSTFRSTRSDTCYLTVKLPKNHHAEITLETFDLLSTSKCIGDYLEIQQYVDATNLVKRSVNRTRVKHKKFNANLPNFKWHTLGTMCGRIEQSYTIKAESDTINFKFRPLANDHQYLHDTNGTKRVHTGFKIFFQAIPPKEESDTIIIDRVNKETRKPTVQTWIINKDSNNQQLKVNTDKKDQSQSNISLWTFTLALIIIILILLISIFGFLIYFIKKRQANSKTTTTRRNTDTKPLANTPSKPLLKNEIEAATPQQQLAAKSEPPKPNNKTTVILEPEPRKMQAERPLLLQDLSQSRLLQKFKQETESNSPKKESEPSPKKEPVQEPSPKKELVQESSQKQDADSSGIYGADMNNLETKPFFSVASPKKTSSEASPAKQVQQPTQSELQNQQADEIEKIYLENASKEINETEQKQEEKVEQVKEPKQSRRSVLKSNEQTSVTFLDGHNQRKPAFNPLHVILKDKNKYHTTEYI